MSSTMTSFAINTAQSDTVDWGEIGQRLVAEFPQFPAGEVLAELVQAHEAASYVGTTEDELADVVEFMAKYALKVRAGLVTPSDRLDPEKHAAPRRAETDIAAQPAGTPQS